MRSLSDRIPDVYGAALAVCGDESVAADVTQTVLSEAARGESGTERDTLAERAVLLAVRVAPSGTLAAMLPEDRDVVALARPLGYSVADVSRALGLSAEAVKHRMLRGLRTAVAERAVAADESARRQADDQSAG